MPVLSLPVVGLVAVVVAFGGLVKGVAGFGYAIASTALLASFLPPSTAVVVMILPMLVANLALLGELQYQEFTDCLRRFWPYVALAVVGTAVGMTVLDVVPTALLTGGIGAFTLAYVAVKQPWVPLPGERAVAEYCFRTGPLAKAGLGFVSGFVFGVSNVAVQVVAYLDSLSLDRATFVGVLAMILVGISGLRVGLAWTFGLYESSRLLLYSALVAVPGVLGVAVGRRLRGHVGDSAERGTVLALLSVIGVRLVSQSV